MPEPAHNYEPPQPPPARRESDLPLKTADEVFEVVNPISTAPGDIRAFLNEMRPVRGMLKRATRRARRASN